MDGQFLGERSRIINLGSINGSGGDVQSIASLLEAATDAITTQEKKTLMAVELRGHDAALDVGDDDHSSTDTYAAYIPYFRENISYGHCINNYVRANGAGAITGVKAEIWCARTIRTLTLS